MKKILFFSLCVLCSCQKSNPSKRMNSSVASKITVISTAFMESGSYGGSLPNEVFPSVYHYSKYNVLEEKRSDISAKFKEVCVDFLEETQVNDVVSLKEYLQYVEEKNQEKISAIHKANKEMRATGSKIQPLPLLIFTEKNDLPAFSLDSDDVSLRGKGINQLYAFLKEYGYHFKSEIPDDFFTKYYKIY